DPDAAISLEPGYQVLDGEQALGFARARKTLGDGSDTARIGRQQQLLAATFRAVLARDVLGDTTKLYGFLDAATASLTTSSDLGSLSALAGLAFSLRGVGAEDLTFVTVPWVPRGDGANVLWTTDAEALWAAVAEDRPLTDDPDPTPDSTPDAGGDTPSDRTPTPGGGSPSLGASDDE